MNINQPTDTTKTATSFNNQFPLFLLALVLHIPLALMMDGFRVIATFHAIATMLVALYFLVTDKSPTRVVYMIGYIAMAEVLWRMTGAGVFWEYAKYAIALLLITTMLKYRIQPIILPILYFIFLLPSVFQLGGLGWTFFEIRSQISFNLSGPLCLMLAVLFFNHYKFSWRSITTLWLFMLVPIMAISVVILYKIVATDLIIFTDESNFLTSGGFGPNQVSAILGLGSLIAWLYFLFKEKLSFFSRMIIYTLVILFFLQSILTYSRGGVLNLMISLPFATLAAATKASRSRRAFFFGILAIIIITIYLLPSLQMWTGGTLSQRYLTLDTSGRAEIIEGQIQTFLDNPFLGVGTGASRYYTPIPGGEVLAAHTEYTRMLAEHGVFGIFSMIFLALMVFRIFRHIKRPVQFWLSLAFAVWALVDMSHAAMRISAVSLMFGLSQSQIEEEES